jgi:Flp pilus assembly protein TadD
LRPRSRSFHVSLFGLALLGPILFLVGLLTRGLALLDYDYFRLGVIFGVMALSAAAASYLALERGAPAVRVAALAALVVNLGALGLASMLWSNEMKRSFVEVQMAPFEAREVGILVCPADHSPREAEEARALENLIRAYVQGAGLADQVSVRPCYPVASAEQARRMGRDLQASVMVWKTIRPVRARLEETFTVSVLGVTQFEPRLEPVDLMLAMAAEGDMVLHASTGLEKPSTSAYVPDVLAPVATGFAFHAAGQPRLAATQFRAALQAANLPSAVGARLHNAYGLVMLSLQRADLATEAFEASNKVTPNASAWVGLGVAAMSRHEWDLAAERMNQAIHLDPYDPQAYCGVGLVLARKRDVQGAMRAYSQAIGLAPSSSVPYALLGLVQEMQANVDSAREAYQLASLYAGASGGLSRAVERRSEEIRRNPPTPVPTATLRPTPTLTPVPTSAIHQVVRGETIGTIAAKYGVSINAIIQINNISDPSAIDIGQLLLIPAKD